MLRCTITKSAKIRGKASFQFHLSIGDASEQRLRMCWRVVIVCRPVQNEALDSTSHALDGLIRQRFIYWKAQDRPGHRIGDGERRATRMMPAVELLEMHR